MKSRNVRYIPQIDQLRLLAALLVFGFHFFHIYKGGWIALPQHAWMALITEGQTGVSLFFVLSGFIFMIIAGSGEAIAYRSFLRNRLLRIAPLFLVVFAVAISINRDRFVATDLLYIIMTNIGNPPTSWHFITGAAWSISLEFAFYLVFPFLAIFTRAQGPAYLGKLLFLLLIVKLGAYLATENSKLMLYSTLVGRFDQFVVGMLAGLFHRSGRIKPGGGAKMVLWSGLVITILAVTIQGRYASYFLPDQRQPFWIVWGTLEAVCWASVIVGFLGSRVSFGHRVDQALATAGSWSFSIYMWHALIIFIVHQLFGSIGGTGAIALALNGLAVLTLTLGFAWLSYSAIEKPFLTMRGRYVVEEDPLKHSPSSTAK